MSSQLLTTEEKKSEYVKVFKNDPLYEYIEMKGLKTQLFDEDDFINEVIWGFDYTTKQASKLLGIDKSQTILNLLNRHDFKSYFEVMQSENGYYSFNHIGLFQLKMVLLLLGNGHQPLDLATIIGTKAQMLKGEKKFREQSNKERGLTEVNSAVIQEHMEVLLKPLMENIQYELKAQENRNSDHLNKIKIDYDIKLWETEMRSLVNQIETLEFQENMIMNTLKFEPSFLAKLFSSKPDEAKNKYILEEISKKKRALLENKKVIEKNKEKLLNNDTPLSIESSQESASDLSIEDKTS